MSISFSMHQSLMVELYGYNLKEIPVGDADDHEEKMQTPTATKMLNFKIEGATISAWL